MGPEWPATVSMGKTEHRDDDGGLCVYRLNKQIKPNYSLVQKGSLDPCNPESKSHIFEKCLHFVCLLVVLLLLFCW